VETLLPVASFRPSDHATDIVLWFGVLAMDLQLNQGPIDLHCEMSVEDMTMNCTSGNRISTLSGYGIVGNPANIIRFNARSAAGKNPSIYSKPFMQNIYHN